MYSNNKISARQLKRLIIVETLGISALTATEIGVNYSGRDGIFGIIIAGGLTYLYAWFIMCICDKMNWNFWGYLEKFKGK